MKDKRELIRVVRTDGNEFSLDFTGKKPGRGAYICPDITCLERSYKQKGLERSFAVKRKSKDETKSESAVKVSVPPEIYARLKDELLVGKHEKQHVSERRG